MALIKPETEVAEAAAPSLDYLDNALGKFSDGPFLLGEFSVADIAYAGLFERFQIVYPALKNYDITTGRPKLLKWIQEVNKIGAYTRTKPNPQEVVDTYRMILTKFQ